MWKTQTLHNSIEGFNDIRAELIAVNRKLSDLSRARIFISSPELVQKLTEIDSRIAANDNVLSILGMIGEFILDQRNYKLYVVSLLTELNLKLPDMQAIHRKLAHLCRIRAIEKEIQNMIEEPRRMGRMHLATGTCLYEGKFGRKNFEEAAQHFRAAADAGRSEAFCFLGKLYLYGKGVERCNATAKRFFRLGADAGYAAAMTLLGRCFLFSVGVE